MIKNTYCKLNKIIKYNAMNKVSKYSKRKIKD